MTSHISFTLSHANQVATLTFNRPEVYNAFNLVMIEQLDQYLNQITNDQNIKILVITASGKHFSSGADLTWMQDSINYTAEENFKDANKLAGLLFNLYNLNKIVICKIHGNVYGGAIGIVACADLKIAANNSNFCFAEVKLGLAPAIVSQFVLNVMDLNLASYYMLTAKTFNAEQAFKANLINEITLLENLSQSISDHITNFLSLSFEAVIATKQLLRLNSQPISLEKLNLCTKIIADLRTSKISQELLKNFLQTKKLI